MSENSRYEAWQANRAICRSLHQFSEKLPDKLRKEYLTMLEDVVAKQKALAVTQGRYRIKTPAVRRQSFLRPLMLYFRLRK